MNLTTPIVGSFGLLIFWLTFTKPRVALFVFAFAVIAFNDYLGGLPSSIMKIGDNLVYGADFFLILLVGGVIRSIMRRDLDPRIDKAVLIMMLLGVGVGICGILIGLDNGYKSNEIIGGFRRYSYYPWAIFIPPLFLRYPEDIRGFEKTAFAAAAVVCCFAAYRIATGSSYYPEQHGIESGYFRAMGYHEYLFLIFVTCLAVGKVVQNMDRPRLAYRICVLVVPIFIITSNYRIAWLLLITSSLIVLMILAARKMIIKPIIVLAAMSILAMSMVGISARLGRNNAYLEVERRVTERVLASDQVGIESQRVEMWNTAIKEWKSAPLLGVGFGRKFYYRAQSPEGEWYWAYSYALHNTYIELLLVSGILGLCIFVVLQVVIFARCWRLLKKVKDSIPLISAGITFMIAVLVQASVQPLLTEPNGIVVFYLIMGSVLSLRFMETPLDRSSAKLQIPNAHRVAPTEI